MLEHEVDMGIFPANVSDRRLDRELLRGIVAAPAVMGDGGRGRQRERCG